jgi:hypothetical protein
MTRCLVLALALIAPPLAAAQQTIPAPRVSSDIVAGYAGFLDESLVGHRIVSATLRYQVTRRLSIGPEVVYMIGPGRDRDLFVTGNAILDFLQRPAGSRGGSVNPYLVAGAGMMHHQSQFADFSATEGAWTAGAGARIWMTERVYALGEYRIGWEPHVRITGGIGVLW